MINFADEPTVKDYLRSFRRHWGVLLFVFLLAAAIGVQQAFFVKPTYKSSATIVADTSTTDTKDYVDKIQVPEVARVVEMLSAHVLSDENLVTIAKQHGLFPELAGDDAKLAAAMHKAVGTEVSGFDAFTVSFTYGEAKVASDVANQVAGMFVNEIRQEREDEGHVTNQMLNAELAQWASRLADEEEAMRKFKVDHQGALPGQTEGNIRAIEKWQTDLEINGENLKKSQDQLALLEAKTPELFRGDDWQALKATVAGLQAERKALTDMIAHEQALVAQSGDVEGRLAEMQRTYNVDLATYNDVLKRRQDASIRVELDRQRFDQLFKITEGAKVPTSPWRPVRPLVLGIALLAGLLGGAAAAVVREYFDETFRDAEELARHTGLPVLAAIPAQRMVRAGNRRLLKG